MKIHRDFRFRSLLVLSVLLPLVSSLPLFGGELLIGGASVSITPDRPVALSGQMRTRIGREVESPVTATALALESRDGEEVRDQAIMISCDLVAIREGILEKVRQRVQDRLEDFDVQKLFLNATHTHTAPVMREGAYELPEKGIMPPGEYVEFLCERAAEAAVEAWQSRKPGSAGWGLGHAVVARNRRSVYADGRAQMYGGTAKSDFRGLEGYEDHGVEVLFFWDDKDQLIATAVNIACPAQEVEGRSAVNADFWHPVREALKAKYGEQLFVLGWTGAAGDQSPHLMYNERAEERMRKLRGLTRLEELSRRIVRAWEEAYEVARKDRHADPVLIHEVRTIELPLREVTKQELAEAKSKVKSLSKNPKNRRRMLWHQKVVKRYERQQSGKAKPYEMELHALRLGDVAIATNDFELFTDFGIQMKAKSPALQTFVIQLAGPGSYIPTVRASEGGGYSAIIESNKVGAQGGQVLTDRTVELLETLWSEN